jgi:hypothetical protein
MLKTPFEVPILFLLFNRPDSGRIVFRRIREIQPKRLYVAVDGPRANNSADLTNCEKCRKLVEEVDWPCEVKTLFRPANLGCKVGVSSAIDWFFGEVEEGIILEDDCLPDQSFFPYCAELLARFRDDSRIMMVSGDNFLLARDQLRYSYYFSRYHFIWGWATWKRRWALYDAGMRKWPEVRKEHNFLDQFSSLSERRHWEDILDQTHRGRINTWDYQWAFAIWLNHGLTICPSVNLVKNIGFDKMATHTTSLRRISNLETTEISWPLRHPPFCFHDVALDRIAYRNFFKAPNILEKAFYKVSSNGAPKAFAPSYALH